MKVIAIWTQDSKGGIGMEDGRIPWSAPLDARRVKAETAGQVAIMDDAGFAATPFETLAGRVNIVVSPDTHYAFETSDVTVICASSIRNALRLGYAVTGGRRDMYLVGGAQVFEEGLKYCDELHVAQIHRDAECEVRVPPFDSSALGPWSQVEYGGRHASVFRADVDSYIMRPEFVVGGEDDEFAILSFEIYRRKTDTHPLTPFF